MTNATETARKYAKLQDAMAEYARENGDGFSGRDWVGANDYCAAGYEIAERAAGISDALDRGEFIEANLSTFPEGDRYLIAVATDYRLAELVADEYRFSAEAA
jgi:hypothetical protein